MRNNISIGNTERIQLLEIKYNLKLNYNTEEKMKNYKFFIFFS